MWRVCLLFFFVGGAHAGMRDVGFTLGPQLFLEGDRIKIEDVKATSSTFDVGTVVTVKGSYTLESHPEAKICIFVTQTEGDGKSKILPGQQREITKGAGDFELSIDIRHEGYLHVTFYPIDGGSGFGGVYFGKSKQMKAIKEWTLDWYLGEPLPPGRSDATPAVNQPK